MKSIIHTRKGECYLCGRYCQTQEHHIFRGKNRKMSEKYGLKVQLCMDCHTGDNGVHGTTEKAKKLNEGMLMCGQLAFEKYYESKKYKEPEWFYNRTPKEKFMELFEGDYL